VIGKLIEKGRHEVLNQKLLEKTKSEDQTPNCTRLNNTHKKED
jgi:hypothetical protein